MRCSRMRPSFAFAALVLGLPLAGVVSATPDPMAAWEQLEPRSRTARLAVRRLSLAKPTRLVALDRRGPILDDGTDVMRAVSGTLHPMRPIHPLAPGSAAPRPSSFWWRDATLMVVDADDRVFAIAMPSGAPEGTVRVGGALYYVIDTEPTSTEDRPGRLRLARHDLVSGQVTPLVAVGHGYGGAIATDGTDVFVADREALWVYQVATGHKEVLPGQFYGPLDLAIHGGRYLVDIHGHGAAVAGRNAGTEDVIDLGLPIANPSGVIGWIGDTALVMQTHAPLTRDAWGELVPSDQGHAAEAIACWRAARDRSAPKRGALHTLYRTAPGMQICEVQVAGDSLAWLEVPDDTDEGCSAAPGMLVTARLAGACE